MSKIKELLKNKKPLFLVLTAVVIAIVLVFSLLFDRPEKIKTIPAGTAPPVVSLTPELKLAVVTPNSGIRETFNVLDRTFFEFSADLEGDSAYVTVSPQTALIVKVYQGDKHTLVVEPVTAWLDSVEYTLTIHPGLRGASGEELRQKIDYVFTIVEPTAFEGGDPLPK